MKHDILLAGATFAILSFASCNKFLDEKSLTKLDQTQVYSDSTLVESSLKGLYAKWKTMRMDEQGLIMMMGTDETQQGALQMKSDANKGSFDRYDANLNSTLSYLASQWKYRWDVVPESAGIISVLSKLNPEKGSKLGGLLGEAHFIRGFLDYQLAMYWGAIPILDVDRSAELGGKRQPLKDVWEFIIADLERAAEFAPDQNSPGRGTSGAALVMLGKAYMSAPVETGLRDFAKAAAAFEKMKGRYSLVDFKDLFDYNTPNTKESILEFQFDPNYPNNNRIQFQIGSRAVQSFFGDGCYYSGYDKLVPTKYAYSMVADGGVWEPGDLRKDLSIRYDFTYNGVTPDLSQLAWEDLGDGHDELLPHIKKYEDYRTDKNSGNKIDNMWNSGKNIPVLRYADALLSYAECLNELGKTAEAIAIVNDVRNRAWGFQIPADKKWTTLSQEEFRTKILDERMRELFAEDWRRIDLIRTGKFVDLIKTRNQWARMSGQVNSNNQIFPIPDTEIKLNPDITPADQNPGYK